MGAIDVDCTSQTLNFLSMTTLGSLGNTRIQGQWAIDYPRNESFKLISNEENHVLRLLEWKEALSIRGNCKYKMLVPVELSHYQESQCSGAFKTKEQPGMTSGEGMQQGQKYGSKGQIQHAFDLLVATDRTARAS